MFGEGFFIMRAGRLVPSYEDRTDKPSGSLASDVGNLNFFGATGKAHKFCPDSLDNSTNDAAAYWAAEKLAKSPDG
jgi:hypothetical protein